MEILLIMLAIALLIAAVVVAINAFQRSKKPRAKEPSARQDPLKSNTMPTFGPKQLGPGAIISHGGIDYVVRGSVTLRQGPFAWWEHLLEGGEGDPYWFSVEEDEGRLQLTLWTRRKDLTLQPSGEHVVDGVTYRESDRGRASYATEGTTGMPANGEMDFVDYANADESAFLGFERWAPDMPWEISVGRSVLPGELTVYPAPPGNT